MNGDGFSVFPSALCFANVTASRSLARVQAM